MSRPKNRVLRRCWAGSALCLSVLSLLGSSVHADLARPGPQDRRITQSVVSLLLRGHLSRHDLDDEISQRCMKTFLRILDPWKIYFTQSDVDAIMEHRDELDDLARKGDVSFAYGVYQTFLKRVDERVEALDGLLREDWQVTDGHVELPTKPGLGFEIDEKEAEQNRGIYEEELGGEFYYDRDGSVADW